MDTFNYYYPPDNTGEGHQMGLWAGGVIERGNHSKMCHPPNGNDGKELTDSPIKSDAFLWVNQQGERFCNEDMDYVLICNRVLRPSRAKSTTLCSTMTSPTSAKRFATPLGR